MPLYIADVDNKRYQLIVQAENSQVATKKVDEFCREEFRHFPIGIKLTKADNKCVIGSDKYEKERLKRISGQ